MNFELLSDIRKNTKLDKRLDYDSELTKYIQRAIETQVKKIVDTLDSQLKDTIESLCDEFSSQNPNYQRTVVHGEKILKVGSFYEDTKIIFPDEFDFIYVLSAFNVKGPVEDSEWKKHYFTLNKLHDDIQRVLNEQYTNKLDDNEDDFLEHCVKFKYYVKKQGPASKLGFTYTNWRDHRARTISVDIVPAFQIFDEHTTSKIKSVCKIDKFANEVISVNTYLITNEISFTETELHFMKNILSDGHRCVYRVLKYLINGDGKGEELRNNVPSAGISTYMVKVATIKHHDACSGFQKESECLLDILNYLLIYVSRNFDDKILCKLNGSPFDIALEDCFIICTWLQNKIEKYKIRFSEDTKESLLKARSGSSYTSYNSLNDYIHVVPGLIFRDTSSTNSVALSGFIQSDRESKRSSMASLQECNFDYEFDILNYLDVNKTLAVHGQQQEQEVVEEDEDKEEEQKEKYNQEEQQQHDIRLNNDNDNLKKSICCDCILL